MTKRQFEFFAVAEDITAWFESATCRQRIKFVDTEISGSELPGSWSSVEELPNLSVSQFGDNVREKIYLILDVSDSVKSRSVKLRNGQIRKLIDQESHPKSLSFSPGGIYNDYECLIPGMIGTVTKCSWSIELYSELATNARRLFKMVSGYLIGPGAEQLMNRGVRLTANVRAPRDYDVKTS